MIEATDFRLAGDATGTSRRALLVAGPRGSETSAFARIFNLLGAALPEHLRPPSEHADGAPRFWEPARVVELNSDALRSAGVPATDTAPVPPEWFETGAAHALSLQAARIVDEEFGASRLFVLEDRQLSHLVPLWEAALSRVGADHAFVIALRDPVAVAHALEARKGLPAAVSLLAWLRDLVVLELATRKRPRRFVAYEDLLSDWQAQLRDISRALEIEWPRSSHEARVEIDQFLATAEPLEEISPDSLGAGRELATWVRGCYRTALELQGDAAQARFFDEVRHQLAPGTSDPARAILSVEQPDVDALRSRTLVEALDPSATEAPERRLHTEALLDEVADTNRRLAEEAVQVARLEAVVETLEAEAEELRLQLAQMQGDLAERADRGVRAEKRVAALEGELETLKAQLEDARELATTESDQVARLETILSEREAEAREQREQAERVGADLREQNERAARAEERIHALEEQIGQLSSELTEARAGVGSSSQQVARLESALEVRESETREQRKQLERLQSELAERAGQAARAEARAEAVDRELERLGADLAERDRRLAEAFEHVREAGEETARLASEVQAAQAEAASGEAALARAETRERALAEKVDLLEEQVTHAEQAGAKSQEQVAALVTQLDDAQREQRQSESRLLSFRMLAERRKAEGDALRRQFDEARNESRQRENELAAVRDEERQTAARNADLVRDISDLRERLGKRETSLKTITEEAVSLREQAQAVSEELKSARADFARREEELDQTARRLRKSLEEATSEAARLKSEADSLREDLGGARTRAKKSTEALESAQAALGRREAEARQARELASGLERRLQAANERLERATRTATEAKNEIAALTGDLDDAKHQLGILEQDLADARVFEQRAAQLEADLERARAVIAMRRTVYGDAYRSMSQFFSWLVRRPMRAHLRHARTYFRLRRSGLFDDAFYRSRYLDVAEQGLNPLMHYIEHGVHEHRDPSPDFSTEAYLAAHPGLLERGVNPLLDFSRRRGREQIAAPASHLALPSAATVQALSEPPPAEAPKPKAQPVVARAEKLVRARGVDYSDFTVLLARQRSGTNALRSVLRSHDEIFCFPEVFSYFERDSREPIRGLPDSVSATRSETNFHNFLRRRGIADHVASWSTGHEVVFLDFLEYLRCFSSKPNQILDVKYNSVHFLTEPWAYNITSPYFFDLLLTHNLRVLNVTRRNYLRYVISNAKAMQTGRWHAPKSRAAFEDVSVRLDIEFMMRELERCYDEDVAVAKRFAGYHNFRSFDYAAIFGPEGPAPEFLTTVTDWLGVSPKFKKHTPAFKKQSTLTLEETVQNFGEVADALRGTKFEYCLEDEPIYRKAPEPAEAAPQTRPS